MSEAAALLAKCKASGVSLRPSEGGKLKVSPPPERLPEDLREQLKRYKQEILALLTTEAPKQEPPPDYRTLYQEKTSEVPEDFPLVDAWLVDAYPALWRQIRELDDELSRLEQQGVPEATYRAKLNELVSFCQEAKALREGHWDMLLVKSVVLGSELVWVVKDEEQARAVMGDGKAVYYAEEFELLKTKTPEQIRDIHKAKLAFPGCRVVQ